MIWLAIPIIGFIIILCVVVKGYTDEQAKRAEMEYRKRHGSKFISEEQVDEYDIECETSDELILKRVRNNETY